MRAKAVDDYQDTLLMIGGGGGFGPMGSSQGRDLANEASKAYRAANNGQTPTEPQQLSPYLKRPVEEAILQRYFADLAALKSSP